ADDVLPLVLASAEEPHVGPLWVGPLADRVRPNFYVDAAPLCALAQRDHIAAVAIDVHEVRVEVGDVQIHQLNLPRTARLRRPSRARPGGPASRCMWPARRPRPPRVRASSRARSRRPTRRSLPSAPSP